MTQPPHRKRVAVHTWSDALASLQTLDQAWLMEHEAQRARAITRRTQTKLSWRVEQGFALSSLSLMDHSPAPGQRTALWLQSTKHSHDAFTLRVGAPVILWRDRPDEDDAVYGVVHRITRDKVAVAIDQHLPAHLHNDGFHLDEDIPQATFARGQHALTWAQTLGATALKGALVRTLLGAQDAAFSTSTEVALLPGLVNQLNDSQQEAMCHALCAQQMALIHGPPGTGKTRTLIALAVHLASPRDALPILATAASNMAVDNLATRAAQAGLRVLRLGHPARVHEDAQALSLDAQVAAHPTYALAQGWMDEARAIWQRKRVRTQRGDLSHHDKRQMNQEARGLMDQARGQLRNIERHVIERAQIICATATGSASSMLKGIEFDWAIVDEATQLMDPLLMLVAQRAKRMVLAGDPMQLPPTVTDLKAQHMGLGSTVFERQLIQQPDAGRMLTLQYRMHEDIMHHPNQSMYEGKLRAHELVAHATLEDNGVLMDPLRPGALVFVDTAGKGWDELKETAEHDTHTSTSNPQQAQRTAQEVLRILSRGVAPQDIAVISPYRGQVRALRTHLVQACSQGLEVSTIDSFQGREALVVVVDTVRSNARAEVGFLNDIRRMNVALSRAKRFLLIVGDSATLGGHTYYDALLANVQTVGQWVSAWSDEAPLLDDSPLV